jgi:magnesium-transporting ATPase (P-type)
VAAHIRQADVVKLVKRRTDAVTLAIGDGANDIRYV